MKAIDVSETLGMVLGQDLTRIAPGEFSGVALFIASLGHGGLCRKCSGGCH